MKKFRNIFIIVVTSITFSCSNNKGHFIITNESDFDVDSLSIQPDSRMTQISLKKGEKMHHNINMDEARTDGSYFISFRNSETKKIRSTGFGYYTNGDQVEDIIKIRILNDTIMTSGKFDFLPN